MGGDVAKYGCCLWIVGLFCFAIGLANWVQHAQFESAYSSTTCNITAVDVVPQHRLHRSKVVSTRYKPQFTVSFTAGGHDVHSAVICAAQYGNGKAICDDNANLGLLSTVKGQPLFDSTDEASVWAFVNNSCAEDVAIATVDCSASHAPGTCCNPLVAGAVFQCWTMDAAVMWLHPAREGSGSAVSTDGWTVMAILGGIVWGGLTLLVCAGLLVCVLQDRRDSRRRQEQARQAAEAEAKELARPKNALVTVRTMAGQAIPVPVSSEILLRHLRLAIGNALGLAKDDMRAERLSLIVKLPGRKERMLLGAEANGKQLPAGPSTRVVDLLLSADDEVTARQEAVSLLQSGLEVFAVLRRPGEKEDGDADAAQQINATTCTPRAKKDAGTTSGVGSGRV